MSSRYGPWLKSRRGRRSQGWLEREIGKSRGYLCRVEAGDVLPPREVVDAIDAALGVSGGWDVCSGDWAARAGVGVAPALIAHRFRFEVVIDVPEGGYTYTPVGPVRCENGRLVRLADGVDVTPR